MNISPVFGKVGIMIDVETALEAVNRVLRTNNFFLTTQETTLGDGRKSFLSQDITADRDQPPFHRVAMDGVAISIAAAKERVFQVQGVQGAGEKPLKLKDKTFCIEVMTGGVLPVGCDLVIPYEKLQIKDGICTIDDNEDRYNFRNIHQKGTDYQEGEILLKKGTKIGSPEISVLASIGKSQVPVFKLPKVCVVSTGDELVDIDSTPEDYQIRKSNSITLENELKSFGFNEVVKLHANDDLNSTQEILKSALDEFNIIILTGGVSKGKYDYVPEALKNLGVNEIFHKIKQRPGKPVWFGQGTRGQCVFGLPGNPVSSLISLCKYFILPMSQYFEQNQEYVALAEDYSFKKEMTLFLPCKIVSDENGKKALPIKGNGSGDYYSLTKSDGFIELPQNKEHFKANEKYKFYSWR